MATTTGLSKRCGCTRSRWVKYAHAWHVHVKFRGRDYKRAINRWLDLPADQVLTRQEAKGHLDKFRSMVREGQITLGTPEQITERDPRLTFGAFCDIYTREHIERPEHSLKGQRYMKWHIRTLRETRVPAGSSEFVLEDIPLIDVSRAHVEAVRRSALTRPADKDGRGRWCMNRSWPRTIPHPPASHLPIAYDAGLPR